jgi:hypothetical protein
MIDMLHDHIDTLAFETAEFPPKVDETNNYRLYAETANSLHPSHDEIKGVCCCCGVALPCLVDTELTLFEGSVYPIIVIFELKLIERIRTDDERFLACRDLLKNQHFPDTLLEAFPDLLKYHHDESTPFEFV